jgi:hypothetical protein
LCAVLGAQENPADLHQQTTPPPNARYEIVQSELAARLTFRLDRFTGHIAQLVKNATDDDTWEPMLIIGLSEIKAPTRPRFQVFTSGLAARYTFLIDTGTGKTWVVTKNTGHAKDGTEFDVSVWQPFAEQ